MYNILIVCSIASNSKYCEIDPLYLLTLLHCLYEHGNQCCQEYGHCNRLNSLVLTTLITM